MIYSMTAFASAEQQVAAGQLTWEIRSVNHRYLDVSFRLPEPLRFIETQLRAALKEGVARGKLECQLRLQTSNTQNQVLQVNTNMINALVELSGSVASSYHLSNDMGVSQVLAWPGVVEASQFDTDTLGQQAVVLFQQTIEKLKKARFTEGNALKAHIISRLLKLNEEVHRSKDLAAESSDLAKHKLLTRLKEVQLEVAQPRIEQEVALMLTKLDVSEELDRLSTHIKEVTRSLECDSVAGRRLDFLMQELNREANTLSSKSDSAHLTQSAVEMKVLIEQMREQIQNIE